MIEVYSEAQAKNFTIELKEVIPTISLTPMGQVWQLNQPARYCVKTDGSWVVAALEAGFECDLDTVPRIAGLFHAWLKGRTITAAVLHDALYMEGVGRELADKAFLRAMELEGVRKRYRYPIYAAVRLFGGSAYKNRKDNMDNVAR